MQIKFIIQHNCIPIRLAKVNKSDETRCDKDMDKQSYILVMRMQIGVAILESPTLSEIYQEIYTRKFIIVLFVMVKNENYAKYTALIKR